MFIEKGTPAHAGLPPDETPPNWREKATVRSSAPPKEKETMTNAPIPGLGILRVLGRKE